MLTWDEDIKPALQNNFALPPQPPMAVPASAATFGSMPVMHGPQEVAAPAVVSHKRSPSIERVARELADSVRFVSASKRRQPNQMWTKDFL